MQGAIYQNPTVGKGGRAANMIKIIMLVAAPPPLFCNPYKFLILTKSKEQRAKSGGGATSHMGMLHICRSATLPNCGILVRCTLQALPNCMSRVSPSRPLLESHSQEGLSWSVKILESRSWEGGQSGQYDQISYVSSSAAPALLQP